jgi:hypothetical protein
MLTRLSSLIECRVHKAGCYKLMHPGGLVKRAGNEVGKRISKATSVGAETVNKAVTLPPLWRSKSNT